MTLRIVIMLAYFAASVYLGWRYPNTGTFRPIVRFATYLSATWAIWYMTLLVYDPMPVTPWLQINQLLHLGTVTLLVIIGATLPGVFGIKIPPKDQQHVG